MTTRKSLEIYPTMKVKTSQDSDLEFEECQAEVVEVKDIKTTYGDKVVITLKKDEKLFDVFVNNVSMKKLVEAYGEEDNSWKGKFVDLKKETDAKYNKEMIVLYPVA